MSRQFQFLKNQGAATCGKVRGPLSKRVYNG